MNNGTPIVRGQCLQNAKALLVGTDCLVVLPLTRPDGSQQPVGTQLAIYKKATAEERLIPLRIGAHQCLLYMGKRLVTLALLVGQSGRDPCCVRAKHL